ncbi:hypothetical protein JOC61_002243 [Marinitoga litoralis]|nr:hypothetical protein [Marinitoga litoralis]
MSFKKNNIFNYNLAPVPVIAPVIPAATSIIGIIGESV